MSGSAEASARRVSPDDTRAARVVPGKSDEPVHASGTEIGIVLEAVGGHQQSLQVTASGFEHVSQGLMSDAITAVQLVYHESSERLEYQS